MKINPHLKEELKQFLIEKIRTEKNRVTVESGYVLGVEEKNILKEKFHGLDWKNAKFIVNEEVIAGVIISCGSRVIDLSLKGSLSSLQKILYESD